MNKKLLTILCATQLGFVLAETPEQPREDTYNSINRDDLLPKFFHRLHHVEDSLRATSVNLMSSMQEGLKHLHEELEDMSKQLKKKMPETFYRLIEKQNCIELQLRLPNDVQYQPGEIEVTNNKTINFQLKDEGHTVSLGLTVSKSLLMGYVSIETAAKEGSERQQSFRENKFTHQIVGRLNFDKVTAEYEKKDHTLTLTIAKEKEAIESRRKIAVTVKK